MLLFLPAPFPPASSCEQTEESQTRPRRLRPHMPVMQPQLPSHRGAGGAGGGGGGGKGRDSTFTCGRQCKSPSPAQLACQPACWPWRYGPCKWPCPPKSAPNSPGYNTLETFASDVQVFGKWDRMRGSKEDPDVAVSLWEDAHWPRVKVVQLASWEEYSASALTFPPHHHPL